MRSASGFFRSSARQRSISETEFTLTTMRGSGIARRSSSETFEQVNQISSGVKPARMARKISPGETASHPNPNDFTCSFISLGQIAYFVTYDDRPANMQVK